MAKKKVVSSAPKRPRGRPRKVQPAPAPAPIEPAKPQETTTVTRTVVQPQFDYGPPYPLPTSTISTSTTTFGPVDDTIVSFNDMKKLWKTKTFWASVCLFLLSMASILFGLPQFANNPVVIGLGGMLISILWVALRMMTNQPVTPSINFPHPSEWFKRKAQ